MEVDAKQLSQWLTDGGAVLVDVREQEEHDAEKIAGAKLIPIGRLSAGDVEEFAGKKIIFHCGGGGRGGRATARIHDENPGLDVYNLRGGMRAWKSAGFETVKSGEEAPSFCALKK